MCYGGWDARSFFYTPPQPKKAAKPKAKRKASVKAAVRKPRKTTGKPGMREVERALEEVRKTKTPAPRKRAAPKRREKATA